MSLFDIHVRPVNDIGYCSDRSIFNKHPQIIIIIIIIIKIIIIINTRFTTIQFEYLNSTKFSGTGCLTDTEVDRIPLIQNQLLVIA